eukprot:g18980.t1
MLAPGRSVLRRHFSTVALGSSACVLFLKYQQDRAARTEREFRIAPPDVVSGLQMPVSVGASSSLSAAGRGTSSPTATAPPILPANHARATASTTSELAKLRHLVATVFPREYVTNGYAVGGVFSLFLLKRAWQVFQAVMTARCGDVSYQIRKPDVLAIRSRAARLAVLANFGPPVLLLCAVGGCAAGAAVYAAAAKGLASLAGAGPEQESDRGDEGRTLAIIGNKEDLFSEFLRAEHIKIALRDGIAPSLRHLGRSNLAEFSHFMSNPGGAAGF